MPISPWYVKDQKPLWTLGFLTDSGNFDTSGLTIADFSLVFINQTNKTQTAGTGTFSNLVGIVGTNPSTIQYQVSSADVTAPGLFEVRVIVDTGTANQRTFSFGTWECKA